ncbi:LAQU0S01e14356g1_1 [Lachancea quebecensis]|uniref:LAQU0S01e14356g1_1 n=1 Tax=Lachancea quebecensis TaxID=1654605 RepID=A0A0P1KM18_9SACH|nr:LAQU0S01e14356g1_1 [Lachancea quebecensis]
MSDAHLVAPLNNNSVTATSAAPAEAKTHLIKKARRETFIQALAMKLRRRVSYVRKNFLFGLFVDQTYIYPVLGFLRFLVTPSFWLYSFVLAFCFAFIFVTVAVLYYLFLLPILLIWAVSTLGPIGFIIVHIQWLLQSNALAITLTNILIAPIFADSIFDATLTKLGHIEFLERAKHLPVTPPKRTSWRSLEFWLVVLPSKGVSLTFSLTSKVTLSMLSLIPIIGPTIVNQLLSPTRGFSYGKRFYVLKNLNGSQLKDKFYEHLGEYTAFGMMAGLLELIPIMSIITIPSNVIAGALWASNELKKGEMSINA